jgi:hypothetical protein
MAIAHKILVAAYNIRKNSVPYRDLGDGYLDQRDKGRTVANLLARLKALGVEVTVATRPMSQPACELA